LNCNYAGELLVYVLQLIEGVELELKETVTVICKGTVVIFSSDPPFKGGMHSLEIFNVSLMGNTLHLSSL